MFIPIFILYITAVGGNYLDFGIIISSASLVHSLIQPYIGYISDKRSIHKIITWGCSFVILALLLSAVGFTPWHLIILYILFHIGLGIVIATLYSIASHVDLSDNKSFIPYYRSIQGIGVIAGPIIGGMIANISLKLNVVTAASFCLLTTICFFVYTAKNNYPSNYRSDFKQDSEKDNQKFFKALKQVIKHRAFLSISIIFLLLELAFDFISFNTSILGEYLKINPTLIGMASSAYFITFSLFQVPINNFLDKLEIKTAFLIMGILSLLSSLLFLVNSGYILIIIAMALSGITIGSLFTYCTVIVSKIAPKNEKGLYLGIFNTIMPLTNVASPIIVAISFGVQIRLPFIMSTMLLFIFVLIVLFLKKSLVQEKELKQN